MNTKESILLEALKLFAVDGYEGVSVRDISRKLSITQAALYKHYQSKQDIFDKIVEHMEKDLLERMQLLRIPLGTAQEMAENYKHISIEEIKRISIAQFEYWTEDEYASCFRKMLLLEQFRNNEMSDLYQNYLGYGVLVSMTPLFEEMIQQNIFQKQDARQLTLDFFGPIFMLISMYDGAQDKESVKKMVSEHIDQFTKFH